MALGEQRVLFLLDFLSTLRVHLLVPGCRRSYHRVLVDRSRPPVEKALSLTICPSLSAFAFPWFPPWHLKIFTRLLVRMKVRRPLYGCAPLSICFSFLFGPPNFVASPPFLRSESGFFPEILRLFPAINNFPSYSARLGEDDRVTFSSSLYRPEHSHIRLRESPPGGFYNPRYTAAEFPSFWGRNPMCPLVVPFFRTLVPVLTFTNLPSAGEPLSCLRVRNVSLLALLPPRAWPTGFPTSPFLD